MSESVADDPKLAPLWDVGQNPQPARKVEARSFRPRGVAMRKRAHVPTFAAIDAKRSELPDVQQGHQHAHQPRQARPGLASLWDAEKNAGINFATLGDGLF